jgi:hypothetical protein
MIADATCHRLGETQVSDESELFDDAAVIWAVLNSIDIEDLEAEDLETVNAVRAWFYEGLARQGISQTDLFEHIRTAVESEDLERLGAAPGPGPEPPSSISPLTPESCARKYH